MPAVLGAALASLWFGGASSPPDHDSARQAGVQGGGGGTDNCIAPSQGQGSCAGVFGVSVGSTTGLVPGLTRSLPVTWSNPHPFDILVDGYTVRAVVPAAYARTCPATSPVAPGASPLAPRVAVPGRGTASSYVPVTLSRTAPDACQRVPFSVTVTATAVKR
ncbi:hypothetical protein SAMN04488570_3318 [Nocardioides scoriae]|uniref:Uncharacterized protein n=1 Tax=Nocardioides scoriae TaxID=642780 RepID=A0A1H1X181_9ACTN|nr:hypothetical protein [Nocardioides scoriae]SDT02299.1 hypothetical protein SAMN04488570_3318 [Nocardioides scoriae]